MKCNDCGFLFNSTYKQLNYEVDYTQATEVTQVLLICI